MRYLIGLAARTFDPEGTLRVPWRDGTESESLTRRVSRVATLDGGVSVTDRGHARSDHRRLAGRRAAGRARRLLRLHSQVTISLRDGAFTGRTQAYDESRQTLTVLITGTA